MDREDWRIDYCGDNQWAIFNVYSGKEWVDSVGDYLCFESQAQASAYLDEFFNEGTQ